MRLLWHTLASAYPKITRTWDPPKSPKREMTLSKAGNLSWFSLERVHRKVIHTPVPPPRGSFPLSMNHWASPCPVFAGSFSAAPKWELHGRAPVARHGTWRPRALDLRRLTSWSVCPFIVPRKKQGRPICHDPQPCVQMRGISAGSSQPEEWNNLGVTMSNLFQLAVGMLDLEPWTIKTWLYDHACPAQKYDSEHCAIPLLGAVDVGSFANLIGMEKSFCFQMLQTTCHDGFFVSQLRPRSPACA